MAKHVIAKVSAKPCKWRMVNIEYGANGRMAKPRLKIAYQWYQLTFCELSEVTFYEMRHAA